MHRPGEPVEEFAERAESEARLTDARKAGAEPSADPITQRADAGMTPQRTGDSQDAIADRLLNDASTPEGRAYARAFSDAAAAHMRKPRQTPLADGTTQRGPARSRTQIIPICVIGADSDEIVEATQSGGIVRGPGSSVGQRSV